MTKSITEKQLNEQNHLSEERLLKNLTVKAPKTFSRERPQSSLIDLINWAAETFLPENSDCGSYIHNKIVINGNFLQFCEEKKVKVQCLLKDSIASWKTEFGCENF